MKIKILSLIIACLFIVASCSNDDGSSSSGGSGGSGGGTTFCTKSANITCDSNFVKYVVDVDTYEKFNTEWINDRSVPGKGNFFFQEQSKILFNNGLPDDYTFIIWQVDNDILPTNTPNGANAEFTHIKNTVRGIGLPDNDDSADFGSAGKLEGEIILYQNNAICKNTSNGSVLHEIAHRWANWIVPVVTGHWNLTPSKDTGRLSTNYTGKYSGIELYLMGLMPHTELTGTDLDSFRAIPGNTTAGSELVIRNPESANAPKEFNILYVVVSSDEALNNPDYATAVGDMVNPNGETKQCPDQNFYNMTNQRGKLHAPMPQ